MVPIVILQRLAQRTLAELLEDANGVLLRDFERNAAAVVLLLVIPTETRDRA
jgi:hypothetical protein